MTQLRKEEQDAKGFFIFDTTDSTYEFYPIKSRAFRFVKVDVTGSDPGEVRESVEQGIRSVLENGAADQKPVIRVELSGTVKPEFGATTSMWETSPKSFGNAVIEIGKNRIEKIDDDMEVQEVRQGILENVSVRDYGMGLFLEKLKGTYGLN